MRARIPLSAAIGLALAAIADARPAGHEGSGRHSAKHKQMTGPEIASLLTGNTGYHLFLAPFGQTCRRAPSPRPYYRDPKVRIRLCPTARNPRATGGSTATLPAPRSAAESYATATTKSRARPILRQPERICDLTVRVVPGNVEKM